MRSLFWIAAATAIVGAIAAGFDHSTALASALAGAAIVDMLFAISYQIDDMMGFLKSQTENPTGGGGNKKAGQIEGQQEDFHYTGQ